METPCRCQCVWLKPVADDTLRYRHPLCDCNHCSDVMYFLQISLKTPDGQRRHVKPQRFCYHSTEDATPANVASLAVSESSAVHEDATTLPPPSSAATLFRRLTPAGSPSPNISSSWHIPLSHCQSHAHNPYSFQFHFRMLPTLTWSLPAGLALLGWRNAWDGALSDTHSKIHLAPTRERKYARLSSASIHHTLSSFSGSTQFLSKHVRIPGPLGRVTHIPASHVARILRCPKAPRLGSVRMVLRLIAALRTHIWHCSCRLSARYAQTTHPAAIVGEKKNCPATSTTGTTRRCEE